MFTRALFWFLTTSHTIKPYEVDEDEYPEDDDYSNDESLNQLVRQILDAAKLDVDAIVEDDPEFISHIGNMIQMWHDQNR